MGKKLKKVECNDRSKPLLPQNKAKGQFIYDSEKPNLHNQLLKQVRFSTTRCQVHTNFPATFPDSTREEFKARQVQRQEQTSLGRIKEVPQANDDRGADTEVTIDSQHGGGMTQGAAIFVSIWLTFVFFQPDVEEEIDEMDDIDKIRDDLQSTKQMLALELRNKEAQIRENKRLQAKLLSLEEDLEKERAKEGNTDSPVVNTTDKVLVVDVDFKKISITSQKYATFWDTTHFFY